MRPFNLKRCDNTLGRGLKRRDARLPHQRHIAALKATSKRIGKVIGKRNQTIAGAHNPQLRQRRRHMRRCNQSRHARAGPYSPGLF